MGKCKIMVDYYVAMPCNISILRKSTGLSQSKFSDYFGIPTATLQDWEHEGRTPLS